MTTEAPAIHSGRARLVDEAVARLGSLDILVNNVSVEGPPRHDHLHI